ncbi:MAG TPA: universal stress protein, partial [Pyrinomonadaceae bacterium]|nr:universal stress protein [Pyrinomonadaceae bacterium]
EKACEVMSKSTDNSIRVISAVENMMPVAAEPFAVSADYVREMEAEARKQAASFNIEAEKIIRDQCQDNNIDIKTDVIMGSPARAIVEEAQDWGADLIVVGSHGYGFWGRTFLGSVSDSVTRHAPCSVLVVRRNGTGNF